MNDNFNQDKNRINLEVRIIKNIAKYIKETRQKLGLGRTEFAFFLGLNSTGERTIRGWEQGEHIPTKKKLELIQSLEKRIEIQRENAPFSHAKQKKTQFTFIDLFAGIGGMRLPFQKLNGKCVFTSEWDKFAQKTYAANFGEIPNGDITKIHAKDIPDHDLLLAGFPCQAFSQAGLKKGFEDTRGTMFFEIQRIIAEKKPKVLLLENVKQLKGHDGGRTLETILSILNGSHKQNIPKDVPMSMESRQALTKKLNYCVDFKVLRARDFGAPQNRERIFIIGFDRNFFGKNTDFKEIFEWPTPSMVDTSLGNILEDLSGLPEDDDKFTISDKLWAGHQKRKIDNKKKGHGFGYSLFDNKSPYTSTLSARYYKDGSEILIDQSNIKKNPRKLTPRECARLQGFPEEFIVDEVSKGQIYKQFGNSVCINVISAISNQLRNTIIKK